VAASIVQVCLLSGLGELSATGPQADRVGLSAVGHALLLASVVEAPQALQAIASG